MMRNVRASLAVLLLLLATVVVAQERTSPQAEPVLLSDFQEVFQADAGHVRLVLLLSPT